MIRQEADLPPSLSQRPVTMHTLQPRRKWLATAVALVCLAAVLAALYSYSTLRDNNAKVALTANRRPPTAVIVDTVQLASMPQSITAVGSLTAIHQVTVSSEVAGQITHVSFAGGETVKKGDVLVQLNDTSEQADLASFQAQQKEAQQALGRAIELQKHGNISNAQRDQLQNQLDVAAAAVERTRSVIAKKKIQAPFDGVLGIREVEVGQYLAPGQPISSLSDLSNLYVNLSVPEQERPKLSPGQLVTLTVDAYPGRPFNAEIAVIDPQIVAQARTIRVQARVPNTDHALSPGMFAKASVSLPPVPNVIILPETAVGNSLYGDYVFLAVSEMANGKEHVVAKRAQVSTGDHFDGRVAVLKGINPGDRVVTVGLTKVTPGGEITVSPQTPTGKSTASAP